MNTKDILLLGVCGTVIAFDRTTGDELWRRKLLGSGFVSLLSDDQQVFAHAHGSIFCLHLLTGEVLWENGLSGLGYGTASLAFPDGGNNLAAATVEDLHEQERRRNRNNS